MAKSIHNAIKTHLGDTLTFTAKGERRTIEVDKLPEASLVELVRYGASRWVNDKLGGLDADEAAEKADEQLGRLYNGVTPGARASGGGGGALSPKDKALRDVFISVVTQKLNVRKSDADKASKREDSRRTLLQGAVANKLGMNLEDEEVRKKTDQVAEQIDAKADEVKSAYESTDVNLGI